MLLCSVEPDSHATPTNQPTIKTTEKAVPAKTRKAHNHKVANRRPIDHLAPRLNIPTSELMELLLSAALDAVESMLACVGKITLPLKLGTTVTVAESEHSGRMPIYLPAANVKLLREICEAANIAGGAEAFAEATLGETIQDSLKSERRPDGRADRKLCGVSELIPQMWSLGDDEGETIEAMLAIVARWNEKG